MSQKPGAVGQYFCDGLLVSEVMESKCAHCQGISTVPNRRRMTDYVDVCRMCNALICLQCAGKPCSPALKRIEQAEEQFYRRSQMMKIMGLDS